MSYTAGPWRVFEHSWCNTSIVADGFDNGICGLDINHATEESEAADESIMAANAKLISAAPELLEALRPFITFNSSEETITITVKTCDVSRARAAVAKAMVGENDLFDV